MRNSISIITLFFFTIVIFICPACMTTSSRIPTLTFPQYSLDPGPSQVKTKSDIEIKLEVVRISDVYNYPNLFSFNLDSLSAPYNSDPQVKSTYPIGPMGRCWEFPFASPDGKEQLLFCICKVKNNTQHILRMSDARVYLILEEYIPLPALSSLDELLKQADYFEVLTNRQRARETVLMVLSRPPLPEGFFRSIVLHNLRSYKLINDLDTEILPGFSFDGILVFPVIPSFSAPARISFFDVTTKTDSAGNPTEKTQFDFDLKRKYIQMWYDRYENKWKVGSPPEIKEN